MDGSTVNQQLVDGLVGMGYTRRLAALALRNSNNNVAEAVRLIQEQPEMVSLSPSPSDKPAASGWSGEPVVVSFCRTSS